MTDQIHYFSFSLAGFAAFKNLGECIDKQLRNHGSCYAVMKVQAPMDATYNITRMLPDKFYKDSPFKPGEQVYFTPCAAPHGEVAEDYRADCKDTTGWTVEKWREYANLTMLLEEAQEAKAQLQGVRPNAMINAI